MTYKFLLTIFITSLSSVGVLAPMAIAQERPKCYLIDNSGQLTDLTDICNVDRSRSPSPKPTASEGQNIDNNNINIIDSRPADTELLGNDLYLDSSAIDSSYYIDNEIGNQYAAYTRRYKASPTSIVRQTLREQTFQFDTNRNSLTSILRRGRSVPFIIYRYQN